MSKIKNQIGALIPTNTVVAITVIATIIGLLSTTVIVSSLLSANQRIQGSGVINSINVSVYSDSQLSNIASAINWGALSPGETITKTVYIQNTGNIPLTLSLGTEDWTPTGTDTHISLAWNYNGAVLESNQAVSVTLSLIISENIQGVTGFNFDIIVTGNQVV